MSDYSTLISYFPNYLTTEALFSKMSTLGAPWSSETGQDMDDAYFTMYSGIKNASDFVKLHLDSTTGKANALTIARILLGIYGKNWGKLWQDFNFEYSPFNNYNVVETEIREASNNRSIDKDISGTDSSNGSTTTQFGQTVDTTSNSKGYVFGFNSTAASPTSEQDDVSSVENGGSDTTTDESSSNSHTTDSTTDNATENETINRERKGLTGQTTYQKLLSEDFELWKWNFYTRVFEDVDKFLTLSVFNYCDSSSVN